jgi:hypothetical protein
VWTRISSGLSSGCLAAAEEEEVISLDDGKEDNDNIIRNEDCENADELNE